MQLRVGVDVGGTFTDLVAIDPKSGELFAVKVASTPLAPAQAVFDALSQLFAQFATRPQIEFLAHSTTIATNALLGQMNLELPRIAFVTTAGFRDVLEIGRQNRSEVYNLFVTRPKPLVAREDRLTVRERLDYLGNVLEPLDEGSLAQLIDDLRDRNIEAVAIGFLHAYVNDTHERRVADAIATAFPNLPVTLSSQVDPEYREYERFSTTVVNAALLPLVRRYLDALIDGMATLGLSAPLYVMQSNGGMAVAQRVALRPATLIESGPASGVIGAAQIGRRLGIDRLLSFDMGGTTAKAGTIVDGIPQVVGEFEAAGRTQCGRAVKGSGYSVRFPFIDLAEVSAGGGSIGWIDDGGSLRVGPLSAGADPGPACYGKAAFPTVTDANVVLGRLNPAYLLGGAFPIDARRSQAAIAKLAQRLRLSLQQTAAGIVRLVDTEMAKVLRIVTIERGLDPRDFTMIAFGGNGPLHACSLAEELGVRRIAIPPSPGVFSAQGLLVAQMQACFVYPILRAQTDLDDRELSVIFADLQTQGRVALIQQGVDETAISFRSEYDARYAGQSFELNIPHDDSLERSIAEFHRKHRATYGYAAPGDAVELVNARVTAVGALPDFAPLSRPASVTSQSKRSAREVWLGTRSVSVPVLQRGDLDLIATLEGPVLIEQYDACTFVAPNWNARVTADDGLILEPSAK